MIERYTLPKMGKIWQDENRFCKWLEVEILACEALAKTGRIPQSALKEIKKKARFTVSRIRKIEKSVRHDLIAFLTNLSENIGKSARYLHFGLTSYDIEDTARAVLMREAADIIIDDLERLIAVLAKKAKKYKNTVMVGRSHGVHAEPITFGLKLALFREEMRRNSKRMVVAREEISFGKISGAVGTYAHVSPFVERYVCRRLGLKPAPLSSQVIQRDRHAQYLTTIALIGSSLEKLATEIRGLQRTEVMEVEEPFARGQKGSSAMPHKRNPIISERICGLARVLRANAIAGMENVNLWHERDISHSSVERIILPDSTILIDYMLNKMAEVIDGLVVYPENMRQNLQRTKGLIFSQRVLLELIKKGLSRERAYRIVQRNSFKVLRQGVEFKDALIRDRGLKKYLNPEEIEDCFDLRYHTKCVDRIFKRLGL